MAIDYDEQLLNGLTDEICDLADCGDDGGVMKALRTAYKAGWDASRHRMEMGLYKVIDECRDTDTGGSRGSTQGRNKGKPD